MEPTLRSALQRATAILCAGLLVSPGLLVSVAAAQTPAPLPPAQAPQPGAPLTPDQLDSLVAPVALYPDPLLSQVLAASTYPLEVVEVQQWLQQNGSLNGQRLIDAAKQRNWDPSVQALVALPDALNLLDRDIRWTTDLGNAFLAQQPDVMAAVQRMRARAEANGKLATTPQQVVSTDTQDGQSAIEIQPADPQVVYVPVYSPQYIWGPPAWDDYPDLWGYGGLGFGFGFGPGIYLGAFFPGWGGWGGWGWGCGWFGGGLFVNAGFFGRYGFHGYGGYGGFGGFGGRTAWAHDPAHRMGVPYPNRSVATRFNSNRFVGSGGARTAGAGSSGAWRGVGSSGGARTAGAGSSGAWRGVGSGNPSGSYAGRSGSYANRSGSYANRGPASNERGGAATRSDQSSAQSRAQSYRSSPSVNRSYSAPRQNYSAPRQSYSAPRQSYSAPRQSYSAPRQSFSAPRQSFSAPRSSGFSGGGSRGFSGGGGGRSFSGGGGGRRR